MTAKTSTVLVLGFARLAKPLLEGLPDGSLRVAYGPLSALRVPFCDLVYQVGGGPAVRPRIFAVCQRMGRRIIKHWVGSDVLRAREPRVQEQHATGLVTHWAVSQELVDELAAANIPAKPVPLSVVAEAGPVSPLAPLPLTVLSYLPQNKFEFYGGETVISLAARFPDVRFMVVGHSGQGVTAPSNVDFLGQRADMDHIYAASHVLLRLPHHDGMSFMVMEALSHGRHVIWNHSYEYARLARTENEAGAHLRELRTALAEGTLAFNTHGREFVQSKHTGRHVRDIIRREILASIATAGAGERAS